MEGRSEPKIHLEGEHLNTEKAQALEHIWCFQAQQGWSFHQLFNFYASLCALWSPE